MNQEGIQLRILLTIVWRMYDGRRSNEMDDKTIDTLFEKEG